MNNDQIYFTWTELDRCADMRNQKNRIEQLKKIKKCHYVPVYEGMHLYPKQQDPFYISDESLGQPDRESFLGILHDELWFSCGLTEQESKYLEQQFNGQFESVREYAMALDEDLGHIALYSRGLDLWQRQKKYCSICGELNQIESVGHKMLCSNGHAQWPRIEPAIIVLVTKGDRCLLGRKHNWKPGVYSTLAGFVEAGETIEDAVYREVYEESNIRINNVRYFGSQPWPFPASLMLAFQADGISEDIRLDEEMEDVRWFSRKELINCQQDGSLVLAPRFTVANSLISQFIGHPI